MATETSLQLDVNGCVHNLRVDPERTLLDVLREELNLTAAKYGCGLAQCGACTVLIDGAPARSCVLRTHHATGHKITTLEGLTPQGASLHPVQDAFITMEGGQCGYCTSGMVMTTVALLSQNPNPSRMEIRQALRHNLCRCGSYTEIEASVLLAARLGSST